MKLAWRIGKTILAVIGFVTTYLSFVIPYITPSGKDGLLGLSWHWWMFIGVTILWIALMIIIIQQHQEIKKLTREDTQMEREKKKLEIEKLKNERPPAIRLS